MEVRDTDHIGWLGVIDEIRRRPRDAKVKNYMDGGPYNYDDNYFDSFADRYEEARIREEANQMFNNIFGSTVLSKKIDELDITIIV